MAVEYMKLLGEKYARLGYKPYRWVTNDNVPPWRPLGKPLSECRLGLVASGGLYVAGQIAFHHRDDASFRAIPRSVRKEDLRISHFAYDATDARRDPNVVFPLDTLQALAVEGIIGGLTEHACSFMGGIYSPRRVVEELVPGLAQRLAAEGADAVLLVPV